LQNRAKILVYSLIVTILFLVSDYVVCSDISLIYSFLFFILNLFIISFLQNNFFFYFVLAILGFIHHLFYNYFQRFITSSDIYNFFTHIDETFETLTAMPELFTLPIVLVIVTLLILWFITNIKTKTYHLSSWIKYPILFILIFLNLNSIMGLKAVDAILNYPTHKKVHISEFETPLYPVREDDINIILIIGESMRYDSYVEEKLKKMGFFYKKIFAGATNTDVSLPLLINSKTNPLKLTSNTQTNLFRLAKKNAFNTAFISVQSENALRYIKPYLQLAFIDYYKSYDKKERKPLFDLLLLEELKKFDLSKKSFIVLEQIGQHSPYHYFDGNISDNASLNYQRSIDYSFEFYAKVYSYLKSLKKPFILIYTSDHGEFSGKNGRLGHNSFESVIYEVPMFIASTVKLPSSYKSIQSHHDLSQFVIYLLGYKKKFEVKDEKIVINGTMLSREDGYMVIKKGSDKPIRHFQ